MEHSLQEGGLSIVKQQEQQRDHCSNQEWGCQTSVILSAWLPFLLETAPLPTSSDVAATEVGKWLEVPEYLISQHTDIHWGDVLWAQSRAK